MSEPCVFVLWERARSSQQRILDDIARRLDLCAVLEVTWPPESFSRNLTRLYGEALPSGSDKERQCGTGPFLVVVAADREPHYGLRRTTKGFHRVNTRLARAKRRYRRWTGGGFRVHGSLGLAEAERDLQLLLGVPANTFSGVRWDGVVRAGGAEATAWASVPDLVAAIAAATPATLEADDASALHIVAEDVWWAVVIAGGEPPDGEAHAAQTSVTIGGRPRTLRVTAPVKP
jgi:hypothetical protein